MKPTWEEITKTATSPGNWSNRDIACFHYFNPNGLWAAKSKTDKQITELVQQGKCANGAILAYGTFNDHNTNALCDMVQSKRITKVGLSVVIGMLESGD